MVKAMVASVVADAMVVQEVLEVGRAVVERVVEAVEVEWMGAAAVLARLVEVFQVAQAAQAEVAAKEAILLNAHAKVLLHAL